MRLSPSFVLGLVALAPALAACPWHGSDAPVGAPVADAGVVLSAAADDGQKKPVPAVPAEAAPPESARVSGLPPLETLAQNVTTYFAGHQTHRVYIQVDKPLYKPGETIWFRAWEQEVQHFSGVEGGNARIQLVSPKGAVVAEKGLTVQRGFSTNDIEVTADAPGGEYKLRYVAMDGTLEDRPIIVSTYEAPRIKKKLELMRKAYGAGDTVSATVELMRPTGEPLANKDITVIGTVDGEELPRAQAKTDAHGACVVKVTLPQEIRVGDGLLTVLVDDGGVAESVSKSIPIVMKRLQASFFPEGGKLVVGLESRVYVEAKNLIGKPADIEGKIVDDQGNVAATFSTYKAGLGRFMLRPAAGRSYTAQIDKPVGITEPVALPVALDEGCVLRSYDDLDGLLDATRVGVWCSAAQKVVVAGLLRDVLVDAAAFDVAPGKPAVAYLVPKGSGKERQGVLRVTLFNDKMTPLAERIVYRHRRDRLDVQVTAHKAGYAPRDQVTLTVKTSDGRGRPLPAEVALSVVDDTVLSYADDKTGNMLSRLYLEPELPGTVEEPNFFFDLTEDKSALALDLLLGTRGYRSFEWQPVLNPPPPMPTSTLARGGGGVDGVLGMVAAEGEVENDKKADIGAFFGAKGAPVANAVRAPAAAAMPMPQGGAPQVKKPGRPALEAAEPERVKEKAVAKDAPAEPRDRAMADAAPAARAENKAMKIEAAPVVAMDEAVMGKRGRAAGPAGAIAAMPGEMPAELLAEMDVDGDDARAQRRMAGPLPPAPVRVFPAPIYGGTAAPEVRSDFRETIHWVPQLRTGTDGQATVAFYLSDAVTSFRVLTEGVSAAGAAPAPRGDSAEAAAPAEGRAGRAETVIKSSLPFSLQAKLPVEVSAGDVIDLPVMLSNERDVPVDVALHTTFGPLLTLKSENNTAGSTLAAHGRASSFFALDVTGVQGSTPIALSARAQGLTDEVARTLTVVPRGFPIEVQAAGTLTDKATHDVDLGAAVPGTVTATVKFYPSPTATLISGLDGMLREPSGCFEQTSSTNYPNVMIMNYLEKNNVADPALLQKSKALLESGYKRLVGYESSTKGYEWFGGDPGHEALTAYGLLEFMDMKGVYSDVDDAMIKRTRAWLLDKRDGAGGFKRNDRALDSFGAASPEVTNAYIVYALTEAGETDIQKELAVVKSNAKSTNDAYLLALYSNALLNVADAKGEGVAATKRLAQMQEQDGSFKKADHSITRSGGDNLVIETTSLALMAMLKAGGNDAAVRKGVEWLYANRGGYGQWGTTQATILALKAFIQYVEKSAKTQGPGSVVVQVNGKNAGTVSWEAGQHDALTVDLPGTAFSAGKNTVRMLLDGKDALPYSMVVAFRSKKPATSDKATIDLAVKASTATTKMGETVHVTATITNKTAEGRPMTLARIGIPGGTQFQPWQLKELREKGKIAFFETDARMVTLYFRDMKPQEVKEVGFDVVAVVPGTYEAPASSAYLYYTNEDKTWVDPLTVTIAR